MGTERAASGRRLVNSVQLHGKQLVKEGAATVRISVCSRQFLCEALRTLMIIAVFFSFSIGLTFYNKSFIKHFKFPLSITTFHFVVKYMMSSFCRMVWECCSKRERVILGWRDYCTKISATGLSCSLDIALSNWSLEFITISLYTMTKSSAIVFILIFAIILKLEKASASLVVMILFIASGLFLFTYHATQFHVEGFLLVLSASLLSGVRWSTAQLYMQKKELGLSHPLDMMYHIQPWMIAAILPLAIGFEGVPLSSTSHLFAASSLGPMLKTVGFMMIGALLAFGLELSEYLLVVTTSSLTLSIAGVVKEVSTLYLAHRVNGDTMNGVNFVGLIMCLVGITLHVLFKAVYGHAQKPNPANEDHVGVKYTKLDSGGSSGDSETELFSRV